ncbi:hypothetical protein C1H46_044115 [Malus baccata]|uniref:Uncharacterized protein n=1 Tax=Malus baccata TaxID=106549 RepID=A0A540K812_MALBA|nr:hypothetical protein C1H46_044115 [Malus baccata]
MGLPFSMFVGDINGAFMAVVFSATATPRSARLSLIDGDLTQTLKHGRFSSIYDLGFYHFVDF